MRDPAISNGSCFFEREAFGVGWVEGGQRIVPVSAHPHDAILEECNAGGAEPARAAPPDAQAGGSVSLQQRCNTRRGACQSGGRLLTLLLRFGAP